MITPVGILLSPIGTMGFNYYGYISQEFFHWTTGIHLTELVLSCLMRIEKQPLHFRIMRDAETDTSPDIDKRDKPECRRAQFEEQARLQGLFLEFLQLRGTISLDEPAGNSPQPTASIPNFSPRWGPCAIATHQDRVVGYLLTDRRDPPILEAIAFYVAPDFRHQGIGAELLQLVETDAREEGFITVMATMRETWVQGGTRPEKFFERCGYASLQLDEDEHHPLMFVKKDLRVDVPSEAERIVLR
jgi:GNAT superfamily N-acetyltransferase